MNSSHQETIGPIPSLVRSNLVIVTSSDDEDSIDRYDYLALLVLVVHVRAMLRNYLRWEPYGHVYCMSTISESFTRKL